MTNAESAGGDNGIGGGSAGIKAGSFANIVGQLRKHAPPGNSTEKLGDKAPSKHLPSTGLKKNTEEYQNGGPKKRASSGASSASSIPSDAGNEEDTRSHAQKEHDQEGAEGQGPGKHEHHLSNGGGNGQLTESPMSETGPGPFAEGSAPKDGETETRGGTELRGHGENSERLDREQEAFKDEMGNRPEGLAGVKKEEPPGPRNEIVLDPRISHIHYHQVKENTGRGLEKGPILKITADGEGEHPPGETPQPSRRNSEEVHRADKHERNYENGMGEQVDGGKWTSAMSGQPRPSRKSSSHENRFSAFREQTHGDRRHHEHDADDEDEDDHHEGNDGAKKRWDMLRGRVLPSRSGTSNGPMPGPGKVSAMAPTAIASVPITTELFAGQLPVMILKTWLDRDEDGHRAVPVLLGNMRFRVGDSVGVSENTQTGKEMFKVECEYGDGAVKWVIYRELRDFLSLHAHYKAANFGTSVAGLRSSRKVEIPEFPKMSIPYLNRLAGREGSEKPKPVGKAQYAQASRDALQDYLVQLIRAVIFRPESNRLCKFFELSSLTLALAPRGGFQGKAGYLRIPGSNASRRANQPGLSPASWISNRAPKWFIVRDSYFVATEGPEDMEYYDVFILDADFHIDRPKRAYRTGLHFLSGKGKLKSKDDPASQVAEENGVDEDNPFAREIIIASGEGQGRNANQLHDPDEADASHHSFFIMNSQRKLKLVARNARQLHQYVVSMERIAAQCIWTRRNRFDSFAPLRVNVAAQWLVDGRDYFWNLSRAINMAKERIYIHDWWISPELYLRRPGDERYRLDNLLKRKAEDGVKIMIIIYNEVSDKTTPVDSLYTKKTLTGLHPNIMVQRSPSHFQTGTFYWSHHEKLCVIDETIAFMGGLDLCYGRWDTSQHVLTDEDFTSPTGKDGPVWRGKDYSNERVAEYSNLDKPFEEMFDRSKVPRMPWHDVGLQIVGQPARDLCRHFAQRWNLLIRTKNHKRRLPFVLPPPEFTDRELEDLQLRGTCEVQICRSVGPWSMGTLEKIEHSIQNAYIKSIELSEHFIYIENQFFITSTIVDGVTIENSVGDALVERIIRAHREKTPWKACIMIPLLPGYTYPIDSGEASSVRLILECQNRTICRGTNSIFSRLREHNIDYITFFSLRGWAKFKSGVLTTEQVYIHGKTMIVDDRLVICGSANINERSQRGDRDSELVAVIRDTDMINGTMAGKPYKVGRFAHTLRVRLMREHIGVDVDSIQEDELMSRPPVADADEIETWDPDHEQEDEDDDDANRGGITRIEARSARDRMMRTVEAGLSGVTKGVSENMADKFSGVASTIARPLDAVFGGNTIAAQGTKGRKGSGDDSERKDMEEGGDEVHGFASSVVPTLEEKTIFERRPSAQHANGAPLFDLIEEGELTDDPPEAEVPDKVKQGESVVDDQKDEGERGVPHVQGEPGDKELYGTVAAAGEDDNKKPAKREREGRKSNASSQDSAAIKARKTLRKHLNAKVGANPWNMPTPTPIIDPNRFHDPLDERFWKDMWVAVAVHNTEIFRKVFRCIPDDLVTSWAQYKAFANHAEKFNRKPEDVAKDSTTEPPKVTHDGPGTHGAGGGGSGGGAVGQGNDASTAKTKGGDVVDGKPKDLHAGRAGARSPSISETTLTDSPADGERKPSGPQDAWTEWEREEMEELLKEVRGSLVLYSTRFLEAEDLANNFLFNILPLPIYD